jgi:hypothetical protein
MMVGVDQLSDYASIEAGTPSHQWYIDGFISILVNFQPVISIFLITNSHLKVHSCVMFTVGINKNGLHVGFFVTP